MNFANILLLLFQMSLSYRTHNSQNKSWTHSTNKERIKETVDFMKMTPKGREVGVWEQFYVCTFNKQLTISEE
jgi:hypothetical protein